MFYRRIIFRLLVGCSVYLLLLTICLAQETVPPAVTPASIPMQFETIEGHDEYVYSIVFSADGKTMVTAAGDNRAILWDWPNRKIVHSLAHDAAVYAAVIRPDGKQVASSSGDGRVTIWSTVDGTKIKEVTNHQNAVHCLSYSKDGKYLASIGGDGRKGDTDCRIWKSQDLALIQKLPGHERPAYWVGFSPTGKSLISSGGDQRINVWEMPSLDTSKELVIGERRSIVAHDSDVYRCDISSDGRWLASASQDKTIKIWDLNLFSEKQPTAPTADKKTEPKDDKQNSPKVVDIKPSHTLGETKDPYYAGKFSRNGKQLATVGDDGMLRLWDTKSFALLGSIKLCAAALYAVAFTPDDQHVIVAGADGELFVVNLTELKKHKQKPR